MKDKDIYYDKKFLQVAGRDAFNVYRDIDDQTEDEAGEGSNPFLGQELLEIKICLLRVLYLNLN